MKKRIMVTGANGYIGKHVVSYLISKGYTVLAADLNMTSNDDRIIVVTTPIFEDCKDIYKKCGFPDALIHLAWRNGFMHNADSHLEDLYPHYRFIKNMIEGGLKSLTVMGSMHEVGYWEGEIDENTPCKPGSLYGIAKNSLREAITCLCQKYDDISFKWTRGYYITGDEGRANSIFSKIIGWEAEGKDTFPFTSGKNLYDFIDVDVLAEQICESAIQTEINGIIECCSGKPMSLSSRIEIFLKEKGFKIRPEFGTYADRPYDSPGVWGNASKINKIIYERKS